MSGIDIDAIFKAAEVIAETEWRIAEIGSLRKRARQLENECGSCAHWMKLGQCPREKMDNMAGRHRGPSMSAAICESFAMVEFYRRLAAEWRADADKLAGITVKGEEGKRNG